MSSAPRNWEKTRQRCPFAVAYFSSRSRTCNFPLASTRCSPSSNGSGSIPRRLIPSKEMSPLTWEHIGMDDALPQLHEDIVQFYGVVLVLEGV